jgi:alkylation response protein AidB-like acyl-CoA dehydrogenase
VAGDNVATSTPPRAGHGGDEPAVPNLRAFFGNGDVIVNFAWTDEQLAYRKRLRDIVERELPANWWQDYAHDGPYPPKFMQFARGFSKVLASEKLIVRHWPEEYGGIEADAWDHIIISEEMWSEGEPRSSLYMGANWAGPAIMKFGTEEQKLEHLRAIAQGEVLWCQGFSEPEAGSDLASLRTKAERQPDGGYLLNGRKIWTSYAHGADIMFVLARMDGTGHAGVTCFLVPVRTPGLSLRTIPAMQSAYDFHESTFHNVLLAASARLGEEGAGWEIVRYVLHNERVGLARYEHAHRALEHAVELLQARGRFSSDAVRAEAANCLALVEAARLLAYAVIDARVEGLPPSADTSFARLAMIESDHAVTNFVASHLPDALTEPGDGRLRAHYKTGITSGIAAGTAEIQLNLIAFQHLGLPKGN